MGEYVAWDDPKNAKLRKERGIGFEDVVFHIERGDLLDIREHPNRDRCAGQRIFSSSATSTCTWCRLRLRPAGSRRGPLPSAANRPVPPTAVPILDSGATLLSPRGACAPQSRVSPLRRS